MISVYYSTRATAYGYPVCTPRAAHLGEVLDSSVTTNGCHKSGSGISSALLEYRAKKAKIFIYECGSLMRNVHRKFKKETSDSLSDNLLIAQYRPFGACLSIPKDSSLLYHYSSPTTTVPLSFLKIPFTILPNCHPNPWLSMSQPPQTTYYLPIQDPNSLLKGCESLLSSSFQRIIERHINWFAA